MARLQPQESIRLKKQKKKKREKELGEIYVSKFLFTLAIKVETVTILNFKMLH